MSKISKKDLINQIKTETNNVNVPNLKDEIRSKINSTLVSDKEVVVNTKPKFRFQLSTLSFAVIILTLLLVLPIVFYNNNSKIEEQSIPKAKEVFMMQATTLFGFASNTTEASVKVSNDLPVILLSDDSLEEDDENENIDYDRISDEILVYLNAVEDIFNKDNNEYELVELTEGDYQFKLIVKLTIGPLNDTYTMYFNETKINENDDDDDLDKISTTLEGYITDGNVKYLVSGQKEEEYDEWEVELKLYLNEDKSDYIKVVQKTELGENEYSYDFYVANKLVKEVEIELEDQTANKTISLELSDHVKYIEKEYEFTYLTNLIKAEFEDDNTELEIDITFTEESYILTFSDGTKIERSKNKNKNILKSTNKNSHLIVL